MTLPEEPVEPSLPPPPPLPSPSPWRYRWIGLMVFALLVNFGVSRLRLVREVSPRSEAFEKIIQADLSLRSYYFSSSIMRRYFGASGQQDQRMVVDRQVLPQALAASRLVPQSSRAFRMIGFSHLLMGRREEALKAFESGAAVVQDRRVPLQRERAFWQAVCGQAPVNRNQAGALAETALSLNLSWYRHIALAQLYRKAGMHDRSLAEQRILEREASRPVMKLFILFIALGLLGLMGLVIGLIYFVARYSLRPAPIPWNLRLTRLDLLESFIFWIFLLTVLESQIVGLLSPDSLSASGRLLVSLGLYALAGVCGLRLLAVRAEGQESRLSEIGLSLKNAWKELAWGAGGYLATLPVLALGTIISTIIFRTYFRSLPTPMNPAVPMMAQSEGFIMRLLSLLLVSVAAPFFEEIFFRGVLYQALRMRFGVTAGVLLSAGLFAIVHPQLPLGFLPIFVLGVSFALLYEHTHSLIPSMVAHGINNGIAFLFVTTLFPK
ncbi:MAG: CPBP family intramembrane metalloprotease [Armatimonadetes bacterium]|nr:CPBP family intramembrane metalloprotease [Armatimonadota bacterium]